MKRLIICLATVALLGLVAESALAGHGVRARVRHAAHHRARVVYRAPVVHHHNAVYRAPIVHHGPAVYHAAPAYRVHQGYHLAPAYPVYSYGQVHHHGVHAARVYVGAPVFSLRIGF